MTINYTTVQNMRSISPLSGDVAISTGYYIDGDGSSSMFIGKLGSSGQFVDNGGTIIVPSGGDGSVAWVSNKQSVSVLDFGAKSDNGLTDNGPIFNECSAYCWQNSKEMTIPYEGGSFGFITPWNNSSWGTCGNTIGSIKINMHPGARLKSYSSSVSAVVDFTHASMFGCDISLGSIDCNSLSGNGIQMTNIQDSNINVRYISTAQNYAAYFFVPNSNPGNLSIFNNKISIDVIVGSKYGYVIQSPQSGVYGVQGNVFSWQQIIGCTANGITIGQNGTDITHYNTFSGGVVEHSSYNGIIDYSGGNNIYVSNTNSNQSNGIAVVSGAWPNNITAIVTDSCLDQTGLSNLQVIYR